MKFKVMFNFLMQQMYSDRTGTDKNHPGQNLPDKRPPEKKPDKNPREQLRQNLYKGAFLRVFCTRPPKNRGGGSRCVTYFRGVPGCVTKCDRGRGQKLAKNSVTYFMDGPIYIL